MELNLNREFIKGAVTGILWGEQQASGYPHHPFTFNVIKEGNFWEIQFIYVANIYEVRSGVRFAGIDEYIPEERTESFKKEIPSDCTIDDLFEIIKESLEYIYKNEFEG